MGCKTPCTILSRAVSGKDDGYHHAVLKLSGEVVKRNFSVIFIQLLQVIIRGRWLCITKCHFYIAYLNLTQTMLCMLYNNLSMLQLKVWAVKYYWAVTCVYVNSLFFFIHFTISTWFVSELFTFKQLLSILASLPTVHSYKTSHSLSACCLFHKGRKKGTCPSSQHIPCPHLFSVPFTSMPPTQTCHHSIGTHMRTHTCARTHMHACISPPTTPQTHINVVHVNYRHSRTNTFALLVL